MKKVKQIAEAAAHLVTDGAGLTDHQNSPMALERMAICNACENLQANVCGICSCYMPGKTTVQDAKCDLDKW